MQKLIEQILEFAKEKKQSQDFLKFLEIFYLQNQQCDFENYTIQELSELAELSFKFFQHKKLEHS